MMSNNSDTDPSAHETENGDVKADDLDVTSFADGGDASASADLISSSRPNPRSPREAIQPEPGPKPPARSRVAKHPIIIFMNFCMSVLMLLVLGAGGLLYYGKTRFDAEGPLSSDRTILIPNGASLASISDIMRRSGVIDRREGLLSDATVFEFGVKASRVAGSLKAGEYLIPAHASMRTIMDTLVKGKAILHTVTLPEGLTSLQIVDRLRQAEKLVGDITDIPAEGSLLPETYTFTRGTTRQEIIERMRREQKKILESIWNRRVDGLPVKTPQELVVLASIVEKETGRADERPRVAGVFINRLNQGIKLQSDPTIIYGLVGGKATLGRSILRSEISKPTPYNTYVIEGLPPGPIANPGRAALEAVANPSRTKDLFFVADGTGGHAFAETLAEHNKNVARWRKIEKKRKEEAEANSQSTN
ncbi:endolytic transglycosylase MltG [Coralliovum pocilloporae]|uniref:endolytic transglycosylase MltG n=1 Tax=Coralliovum pocilloporae TaxID=3066369 RepID=UPI0033075B04